MISYKLIYINTQLISYIYMDIYALQKNININIKPYLL